MSTLADKHADADAVPHRAHKIHAASACHRRDKRKLFTMTFAVVTLLTLLAFFHAWDDRLAGGASVWAAATEKIDNLDSNHFDWDSLVTSSELDYQSCYGQTYQCARFETPMDWNRTDGKGSKMSVAVIRFPAPVPVTDPRYGGPIFINPGGPGGSGVDMVQAAGRSIQYLVNPDEDPNELQATKQGKYFDIISFDPRAIGLTTPSVSCFPDNYARTNWRIEGLAIGMLGSAETALKRHWYRSKANSEGCSRSVLPLKEGEDALGEHVNTTPTVKDMLEIAEAHDRWVQKQKKNALQTTTEPVKLQYWGFSYGTVIGQTFAAMYPDRVGRVIVDGVVDPNDYHHGPWLTNLPDTDKILLQLFTYCAQAGPTSCPMHTPGGPEAILASYDNLLRDIYHDPFPVPATTTRGPVVITWSDLVSLMRLAIYQPLTFGPHVFTLIGALRDGNGTLFADWKHKDASLTPSQLCPSAACKSAGPYSPACNTANYHDASMAIMCTDGPGLGQLDLPAFEEYMNKLANQSSVFGHWWSHERLGCVGWKALAKWRFDGPFAGATAHPLLFIGNRLDPVTPLGNAARQAKAYKSAVLLQQDSEGHTTVSAPSICTAKIVRTYFQTGDLPPPGTVCEPMDRPFIPAARLGARSAVEEETLRHLGIVGDALAMGSARW